MNIITWILTIALGAMVILSGIFKITKNKKITEMLSKLGVAKYIPLFGIAEIIFALLFIYPATRNIGFVLLICYFSGALATDLSHKNTIVAPLVFLTLLFVAEFLFNPALFIQ